MKLRWLVSALCAISVACGGSTSEPAGDAAPPGGARDVGAEASPDGANEDAAAGALADGAPLTEGGVDASTSDASPDAGDPCAFCRRLPHVKPDAAVSCANGRCNILPDQCTEGFGHCSLSPNEGCETDLSAPENCGSCNRRCPPSAMCSRQGGVATCVLVCGGASPDSCGTYCTDFQTSVTDCGGCGANCYAHALSASCVAGACANVRCVDTWGDCTPAAGCESSLHTVQNCGACGRPSCSNFANTILDCTSATDCPRPICQPGFADCDPASPDCEGGPGAPCQPRYLGTKVIRGNVGSTAAVAIAPDGAVYVVGSIAGDVDFDPGAGVDIQRCGSGNAFVTKQNADGTYAWTRTLSIDGSASAGGLAAGPDGSVVVVGSFTGQADFDPGAGVASHVSALSFAPFVWKVDAQGNFVFASAFDVLAPSGAGLGSVAFTPDGGVLVGGGFGGTLDLDPGPGMLLRSAVLGTGFFVQLDRTGALEWSRVLSGDNCSSGVSGVASTPDGTAWATGSFGHDCTVETPGIAGGLALSGTYGSFVIPVGSGGVDRPVQTIASVHQTASILDHGDGTISIGGAFGGAVDFDPGAGVATRTGSIDADEDGDGFVLHLDATGAYRSVVILPGYPVYAMARAPDGAVVAAGTWRRLINETGSYFSKVPGGTSTWTVSLDIPYTVAAARSIAIAGSTMIVVGVATGAGVGDFDPGPPVDLVEGMGDYVFISRYGL